MQGPCCNAPTSLHLERRPDKMFFLRRLAGMATVSPSARAAASAHASTSQSAAAIREMRRSRQKGDNMRQTIATMNVPPRLLGLHTSSGHLSERTSCRGEEDTAALKTGCNTSRCQSKQTSECRMNPIIL